MFLKCLVVSWHMALYSLSFFLLFVCSFRESDSGWHGGEFILNPYSS